MSFQVMKRMSLFGSFITFAAMNCVYMIVVKSSFVMSGICVMANVHLLFQFMKHTGYELRI